MGRAKPCRNKSMGGILLHWLPTWYVSALPAMFILGCALSAYLELRRTSRHLGGEIRSRDDLALIHLAITTSLRTGALMAFVYLAFLFVNVLCVTGGVEDARVAIAHVMAISLLLLPVVPTLLVTEARLKDLDVVATDPAVRAAYDMWLHEWKEL